MGKLGLRKKLLIGAVGLLFSAATFSSTLAWFSNVVLVDAPINGDTEGAFFGGGDGSQESPYIINHPIHVYNLAWLQYLGEFNKKTGNNLDQQYYFTVTTDIDMAGLVIPPIGTTENPFVGNLNGQDHIISNFITTNDFSDFEKKPSMMTEAKFTDANIVGFFGVVGKLSDDTLVYETSSNKILNLGLKDFTVNSNTTTTLAGLAAGYVNGTLSGVAINDGDIHLKRSTAATTFTNNISDYGTVGYCEPAYREKCNIRDIKYYDPDVKYASDDSGGDQWGASIAMQALYNDITSMNNNGYSDYYYVTAETRVYDSNGELVSTKPTATAKVPTFKPTSSSPSHTRIYNEKFDEDGNVIASYSMNTRGAGSTQQFNYMTGETTVNGGNKTVTIGRQTFVSGYVFTDENGNYLSISASGNTRTITNATSEKDAAIFQIDGNGRYYTNTNNTNYYLRFNNNALSYTTTANDGTIFNYDANSKRLSYTTGGTTYLLYYYRGWKMGPERPANGFLISSSLNNTIYYYQYRNRSSTDENSATIWYLDASNRLYCYNGNNGLYYLGFNSNETNTFSTNTTQTTYATLSNGVISCIRQNDNTTYYLRLTSSWLSGVSWGNTNAQGSAAAITTKDVTLDFSINRIQDEFESYTISGTQTETSTFDTKPTYIPLTWEDENRTIVSEKNTGYLVSGARDAAGDIRVSRYSLSDISASHPGSSYTDTSLQVVTRTKDTPGYVRIKDTHNTGVNWSSTSGIARTFPNYWVEGKNDGAIRGLNLQKYKSSRNYLQNVLRGQSDIYGLHFMNYPISMNYLTSAAKVTINGPHNVDQENKVYYDYQLPQGSIDFNLKKKGYINFFAGTYFSGNNSFFALSEIIRDENNNITNIKEISKIYTRTDMGLASETPYVYQYKGEPVPANAQTMMFDVSWITSPTILQNALYYFEFPMNPGEYALGAEEGKTGAYLIYLDIGAANKTVDTTVVTEKYSVNYNQYEYPKGADFYLVPTSGGDFDSVQGGTIAAISISANAVGVITFNLTDMYLTCGPPASGTIECVFEGEGVIVKDTNNQVIHATPLETGEQLINKVTSYYYRHEDMTFSYDIITETIEPGMVTPEREEFISPIEEDVQSNPYDGTQEYLSDLTTLVSGFRLYTKEDVDIDFNLVLNPLTDEYVITFTSTADVDVILKIDDSIVIPSRFVGKITISNVENCPPLQAGEIYEFSLLGTP